MGNALRTSLLTSCLLSVLAVGPGCEMLGLAKPSAKVVGVKVDDVGLRSARLVFDVNVENPYSSPLPLGNLDYSLASEGKPFLKGESATQGSIPAKGAKVVNLPVDVPYQEVYSTLSGLRGKDEIPYTATLGLSVDTPVLGKLRLPMEKAGTLPLPKAEDALRLIEGLR